MSKNITTTPDNDLIEKSDIKTCENCHTAVEGMYCSKCGQSVESTLKYFWSVILHLLDDVFSFDSRASRTLLPLMCKPGFLTNEYIVGRRVHYVPPLRLYLFISIIFFISLKFFATNENSGVINIGSTQNNLKQITQHITLLEEQKNNSTPENIIQIENDISKFTTYKQDLSETKNLLLKGLTSKLVEIELDKLDKDNILSKIELKSLHSIPEKISKLKAGKKITDTEQGFSIGNNEDGSLSIELLDKDANDKLGKFAEALVKKAEKAFTEDSTPLIQEAIEKLPQLMFVLLPLFALLLKLLFIFSKRLYLEHLTVALHSHSFIFLSILLIELLEYLNINFKTTAPIVSSISAFLTTILLIWVPIYLFVMQKRVYKQGNVLTLIKFSFIGTSYMLMIVITGAIAFIWGLAST